MSTYLKLFVDCLEKYQKINDAEFGRLIRAALHYKANGEEVKLTGREELLWDGMKLDIDRDNKRYVEMSEVRAEAGRRGAESRWQTDSKNGKCHLPYGKNGQDKDKEEDKDKDKRKRNQEREANDFFDSLWTLYPRKEGKGGVSLTQRKKLLKIGLAEMTRAINRYKQAKADTELKYWKIGGTFFNSGYIDFLDANFSEDSHADGSSK